jgi:hypothetical protein
MEVFSVLWSYPRLYNQKLRPASRGESLIRIQGGGSRQSKVIARKALDWAKKTQSVI